MPVKIISWNVNGLRAALTKGIWNWLSSQEADIICLQEIKVQPDQLTAEQMALLDRPVLHWNPAQKRGYSGVATFLAHPADETIFGLGVPDFDNEGRVIQTRHGNLWLFNVYVPNGQRGHDRVAFKLDFYQSLLERCVSLMDAGFHVVICGDINTAHREIDLKHPRTNQNTSGFLPEERAWIDKFLEAGLVDIFRDLNPEKIQYSWWTFIGNARSNNVGWRIDYFLISRSLAPLIVETTIHDDIPGSDHAPISLVVA